MADKKPRIGLLLELDKPAETAQALRYQLERLTGQPDLAANKLAELDQQSAAISEALSRNYAERAVMAAFWRSDEFETRVQRFLSNLPVLEDLVLKAAGPWDPEQEKDQPDA